MINETKSKKYTGVYIRTLEDKSKTFYIVYKDPISKKTTRLKIGNSKDGFHEAYCNNKRNEIISKLRLGDDPNIPILQKKQQKVTLNDIALKYFDYKALEGITKSLKDRQSKYHKHFKDLANKPLQSITKNDGINLQKKLIKDSYSNATVNAIVQLGSTIFNYAIKEGLYESLNPFQGLKRLNIDNDRQRYLTKDDIKKLKDSVKDDEVLYLFVLLSLSTGARLESVLSIQKKDIDFQRNIINIYDTKNKNRYVGALIDEVKTLLQKPFKSLNNDDYIVSYNQGKKMDKKRIQRRLGPILNKLFNKGIKADDRINRVVIHTLRHTFASLLAIEGTPIYTIQKLMNHKDIKQTTRYAKLSPESGTSAVLNIFD
jgi:integrase